MHLPRILNTATFRLAALYVAAVCDVGRRPRRDRLPGDGRRAGAPSGRAHRWRDDGAEGRVPVGRPRRPDGGGAGASTEAAGRTARIPAVRCARRTARRQPADRAGRTGLVQRRQQRKAMATSATAACWSARSTAACGSPSAPIASRSTRSEQAIFDGFASAFGAVLVLGIVRRPRAQLCLPQARRDHQAYGGGDHRRRP